MVNSIVHRPHRDPVQLEANVAAIPARRTGGAGGGGCSVKMLHRPSLQDPSLEDPSPIIPTSPHPCHTHKTPPLPHHACTAFSEIMMTTSSRETCSTWLIKITSWPVGHRDTLSPYLEGGGGGGGGGRGGGGGEGGEGGGDENTEERDSSQEADCSPHRSPSLKQSLLHLDLDVGKPFLSVGHAPLGRLKVVLRHYLNVVQVIPAIVVEGLGQWRGL